MGEPELIEIVLRRAPDDPPENDPQCQAELREFSRTLRDAGLNVSQRAIAFDARHLLPELLRRHVQCRPDVPIGQPFGAPCERLLYEIHGPLQVAPEGLLGGVPGDH